MYRVLTVDMLRFTGKEGGNSDFLVNFVASIEPITIKVRNCTPRSAVRFTSAAVKKKKPSRYDEISKYEIFKLSVQIKAE